MWPFSLRKLCRQDEWTCRVFRGERPPWGERETLSLPADEVKSVEEDQREVRQPDSRCEGGDRRARRAAGQRQWGRQWPRWAWDTPKVSLTAEHEILWRSLNFQAPRDHCWAARNWGWLWLLALVQHHPKNLFLDPRQVCRHLHRLCSRVPTLQIWELQIWHFHSLLRLSPRLGPCIRWAERSGNQSFKILVSLFLFSSVRLYQTDIWVQASHTGVCFTNVRKMDKGGRRSPAKGWQSNPRNPRLSESYLRILCDKCLSISSVEFCGTSSLGGRVFLFSHPYVEKKNVMRSLESFFRPLRFYHIYSRYLSCILIFPLLYPIIQILLWVLERIVIIG